MVIPAAAFFCTFAHCCFQKKVRRIHEECMAVPVPFGGKRSFQSNQEECARKRRSFADGQDLRGPISGPRTGGGLAGRARARAFPSREEQSAMVGQSLHPSSRPGSRCRGERAY